MGVQYVLEGTVRWSKVDNVTKVRITPQLIRVEDDRHMWANNYERALLEVFSVDLGDFPGQALGHDLAISQHEDPPRMSRVDRTVDLPGMVLDRI